MGSFMKIIAKNIVYMKTMQEKVIFLSNYIRHQRSKQENKEPLRYVLIAFSQPLSVYTRYPLKLFKYEIQSAKLKKKKLDLDRTYIIANLEDFCDEQFF
jgi:hypothetical protein